MNTPRKRGRPPTFTGAQRKQFAAAIEKQGIRKTQANSAIPISLHTLGRIAHEFGIELRPGRYPIPQEQRQELAKSLAQLGIKRTRESYPEPISEATLSRIASEFQIKLKSGRPKCAKAIPKLRKESAIEFRPD